MPITVPFKRASITLTIDRIIGGVPTDPNLIAGWLKANMPDATEAAREKLAATTLAEVPKVVDDESKAMWTTFKRTPAGHVCIESRQVKSAFKEAANILRETLQTQEGKDVKKSRFTALRAKLAERLFVEGDKLTLLDPENKPLTKPTGTEETPIHVMTAQGPRTALKKYDYCSDVRITFVVRWLDDKVVDEELVRALLEFMAWNGLGASRSQGNGQFTWTLKML